MSGFIHREKKYPEQFKLYVPVESRLTVKQAKEIAKREGESLSQKFIRFCENYVRLHAEGNPQMVITKFTEKRLVEKRCEHPGCTQTAAWVDYSKLSTAKPRVYHCLVHHEHALENQLLKKSKPL